MKTTILAGVAVVALGAVAYAQTRPLGLPQFANPPESNGADPTVYPNGVLYNTGLSCSQRSNGATWLCLASQADVTAANSAQDSAIAATYMPTSVANAAIATMNGRIDGVQASVVKERACGTATLTGLSVSLAGISSETAISIPNVPVGTSCDSGSASFMPLGARPDAIVTVAGTVRLRFVSNGGVLSSVISIPNGTYRICCDL